MKKITKVQLIKGNSIALALMICGVFGKDFPGGMGAISSLTFCVGTIVLLGINTLVKVEE